MAYNNSIKINSLNMEAWLEMGKTLSSNGKRDEAMKYFNKTIAIYNTALEDSGSELKRDPFRAIDPKALFNEASNYVNKNSVINSDSRILS